MSCLPQNTTASNNVAVHGPLPAHNGPRAGYRSGLQTTSGGNNVLVGADSGNITSPARGFWCRPPLLSSDDRHGQRLRGLRRRAGPDHGQSERDPRVLGESRTVHRPRGCRCLDQTKPRTPGSNNILIGYKAAGATGTGSNIGSNNIYIGANTAIPSGSHRVVRCADDPGGPNNVIIGGLVDTTTATYNNVVVLADGAGNVKMRWDGINNAVQSLDAPHGFCRVCVGDRACRSPRPSRATTPWPSSTTPPPWASTA